MRRPRLNANTCKHPCLRERGRSQASFDQAWTPDRAHFLLQQQLQVNPEIGKRRVKRLRGIRFGDIGIVKEVEVKALVNHVVYRRAHSDIFA